MQFLCTIIALEKIAISGITVAFAANNGGLVGPKGIFPGAITSTHIKDEDIQAADIGPSAVEASEIKNGEVGSAEIATDAVNSTNIKDGTVATSDIDTGAVTTTEIADETIAAADINTGAVKTDEIYNETIDDEDLGDAAIPSVVVNDTTTKAVGSTWTEEFRESIITERKMAFIFTYAANLTQITTEEGLLVKACVVGQADPQNQTYKAEPSPVKIADDTTAEIQRTVTFTNSSVEAGNYYVNVSVKTTASGANANITDQVFTVIALPTT